jgi:membrane protease YdiL (CAAX protease family)
MQTTSSPTSDRPSAGSRRTSVRAGALGGWLTLAALQIGLSFLGRSSGQTERNALFDWAVAASGLVAYAILIGLTVLCAQGFERPRKALGLRGFERRWLGYAALVVLGALVLSAALEPLLHAGKEQGLEPTSWQSNRAGAFAANAIVIALLAPFAEELFFRGLGVRALLPFGGLAAIAVSALAFGLGHGLLVALPVLVVFGAGLGWVRLRSGSVWPGMLAHGFYNGAILLYVYLDLTSRV